MKALIPLSICLSLSCSAQSQEYIKAGQYTEIKAGATIEQLNPLKVIIDFTFPTDINNVGEALNLLLMPSGYTFNLKEKDIAYILFNMPLPEVHKKISMLSLMDAIAVLSGSGFIPVYDHDLRQIEFKTNSEKIKGMDSIPYKELWSNNEVIKKVINIPQLPSNFGSRIDYTVKRNDSISKILLKHQIKYSVELVDQIIKENPHAFINNNPNLLIQNVNIRLIK